MSHFSRAALAAHIELSAEDQAATDTGAHSHISEVLYIASGPEPFLSQGTCIGVVFKCDRGGCQFAEDVCHRQIVNPQIHPAQSNPPLPVDASGYRHTYAGDRIHGYVRLSAYLPRQPLQLRSHLLISGRLCRFAVCATHLSVRMNESPCHFGPADVNSQPPLQNYAPAYLKVFSCFAQRSIQMPRTPLLRL